MIFVTGDCHSEFNKLSSAAFPEQKDMTKDDVVIICGDFGGIWDTDTDSRYENYWLQWLDEKPFTTVFVDGNHENFDRLNSEFETVPFYGGQAHRIRNSVYHLMRGEVYTIQGKTFFTFGGAASHDIQDGILDSNDFPSEAHFKETVRQWRKRKKQFRVKNVSWWPEEMPSEADYQHAEATLSAVHHTVDYVITHCAPQSVLRKLWQNPPTPDELTLYFDDLAGRLQFGHWFFGHYHEDRKIDDRFILLYDQLIRIH